MKKSVRWGLPVVLAAALLSFLPGCENDLLQTAPAESNVNLSANPATIILNPNLPNPPRDPDTNELMGSANIIAQVLDTDGRPVEDVVVYFSASGGRLGTAGPPGSLPTPVTTDVNGFAVDTLTVTESSPATITVAATSGNQEGQVTVTRSFADCENAAPVASAGADQTVTGDPLGTVVELDGAGSTDAETARADLIFSWDCGNGTEGTPTDSSTPWIAECTYDDFATFTATLTVTDEGNGPGDTRCVQSDTDDVVITIEEAR